MQLVATTGGTRHQILEIIQREGPATVEQLCQFLGLASATIRRHLDILQRDHLVSFKQARKKLGRPEYIYSLTEDGLESGRRDYRELVCLLLTNLRAMEAESTIPSRDLVQLVMQRVSDQLSEPYLGAIETGTVADRTATLEQALTDIGFAPQLSDQDGQLTIRMGNCPFRAAALCDKSVCQIDRNLIQVILGSQATLQSSIPDGGSNCTYVLPTPVGSF